ncbi:MAG: zinc-ribbon domain-containing protein [Ruminiclostridium sp.]|nr:zinc-ribbon domain-containing protein [Ruminiclostridium sp.]
MYCKNCGNEIDNGAAICLKCGTETGTGVKFYAHCGSEVYEKAKICIKCGYSTKLPPPEAINDAEIFCMNCGKPMKEHQAICLSCGAKNGASGKYCRNCGAVVKENAEICLKCGCEITTAPSVPMPNMGAVTDRFRDINVDKIKDGVKNINADKIKGAINDLNTDAITEHKYSKYFGIMGCAVIILSYLLPFFNIVMEAFGVSKTETINGFTAITGSGAMGGNFMMVVPLVFCAFQIAAQFVKPLEKYKNLSNLIAGGGCFISLIISAIIQSGKSPTAMANLVPTIGFFVALLMSPALVVFGLILHIKKK